MLSAIWCWCRALICVHDYWPYNNVLRAIWDDRISLPSCSRSTWMRLTSLRLKYEQNLFQNPNSKRSTTAMMATLCCRRESCLRFASSLFHTHGVSRFLINSRKLGRDDMFKNPPGRWRTDGGGWDRPKFVCFDCVNGYFTVSLLQTHRGFMRNAMYKI